MIPSALPAILIRDLHYAYPPPIHGADPVRVLRGVELEVGRGEFVALLGRAGAGKTTLCMALNGLVPHVTGGIFRGDVTVLGQNTKRHAVADLARSVGLVFQDAETQLTQMRVEDEVAFGPENLGLPPAEIDDRVTWALDAVGLTQYRDRSPLLLSGGEKQRVAIAAMLAMRPEVLVLDEPTANLDPAGKASVFNLLVRLAAERRIAIVLASQELERVARYTTRVAIMDAGTIALDGPPAEIFTQVSRLQEIGIGTPQLAELADRLTRATGHPYRFLRMGDAYAQLRRVLAGTPPAEAPVQAHPAGGEGFSRSSQPVAAEAAPAKTPIFRADGHAADGATAPGNQAEHPERSRGKGPGVVEGGEADVRARPHPSTTGRAPMWPSAQDAQIVISGADDAQVRIEHLAFNYPDGPPVLRDVSLTIGRGEFVALLGPNGSGKTTLAKHLNGLLKPDAGCVRINGRDTRPLRVAELARTVGYVFQDPDHQIFSPTVGEEVAFGLRLQGLPAEEVKRRAAAIQATFDLTPVASRPPALLGWGQRRQVALASVLATRPEILVLDEPTGGLDAQNRAELMAALTDFHQQGATIILVTHNVRLVAEHASRTVVLSQGGVVFDGAPAQLFERREILSSAKLAVPPVVRLAQRLAPRLHDAGIAPGVLSCADFVAAWQRLCGQAGDSDER